MRKSRNTSGKTLISDARNALAQCAGVNVRLAERRITHFLEQRMSGTRLSLAQFGLLAHIAAAPEDTITALAERAGLDQSTLSRNLRGLEDAGLVEIVTAEKDLRRRAVWLTETGARQLEAALVEWRNAHGLLSKLMDSALARQLAAQTEALISQVEA
jgi:DNA-binding MarR family transcriptional regulator